MGHKMLVYSGFTLQTIRIQSAEHGTKRIQSKPTERIQDFLEKVQLKNADASKQVNIEI